MSSFLPILNQTLMVTGFVLVMMLVIEYVHVLTAGQWQKRLLRSGFSQYALAALLGATPGCLGAFAVVAMYSHRMVSLGALVAAMIATSGDESFVMFALIPREAVILTGVLFVTGVLGGYLTDGVLRRSGDLQAEPCKGLALHQENACRCYPRGEILAQLRALSPFRAVLLLVLALFMFSVVQGQLGPEEWGWVRSSILLAAAIGFFIVLTVPDHFLEEHLWNHIARRHVPRIFLWTLGSLLVLDVLLVQLDLTSVIQESPWLVLGASSLVGIVPESGPHLIFVTLFHSGTVPFSILLASSIVQDGHGMLPVLAHSRRTFVVVKAINLVIGAGIGALALGLGL